MARVHERGVSVYPDPKSISDEESELYEVNVNTSWCDRDTTGVCLEQDDEHIIIRDLDHLEEVYKQAKLLFQRLDHLEKIYKQSKSVVQSLENENDTTEIIVNTKKKENYKYKLTFKDDTYEFNCFSHVVEKFFKLVYEEDMKYIINFYNKYSHTKPGCRNFIDMNKYNLYPERLDLCNKASKEFVPGWWMGTNYNTSYNTKMFELLKNELPIVLQTRVKFESNK